MVDHIAVLTEDFKVLPVRQPTAADPRSVVTPSERDASGWLGYVWATLACAATALMATPLLDMWELSNIVMLFLLAVVGVSLAFGRGPAVLAAFLGVGLFNFLFVPPRFTFAVSDVQYVVTFVVMLVVALVVGQLTAVLKQQVEAATQRERRMRSLYDMSRDLSAALLNTQVTEIGARFLSGEFGARSTLLVADEHNRLQPMDGGTARVDMAVAQWAFDRGEEAGQGTASLPASACLVLPLKAPMRVRGVLVIEPAQQHTWHTEQRRLLQTCASLLAISLERIHYIEVAQSSTVQIESERLRNSLLSAISHDLRTPLTSMVGLADALELTPPGLSAAQLEVAGAMRQSAQRMSALVNNLLDMARLQAGAVQLNLAWQPLEEVVGSALAACDSLLAGRDVRVDLPDGLPLLYLDAVLIERVLVNLLENASKYTPAGSAIDIAARLQNDAVVLSLDDHGPGLPAGREDQVFEKFERGQRESATPGVGLGLAICRAIVAAHGGLIGGHNRGADGVVQGARFEITLPCGTPPSDMGATSATETVPAP